MGSYFLAAVFYQAALKELVSWFDGGVEYEFYGLVYGDSGGVVFWRLLITFRYWVVNVKAWV